MSTTSTKPNSWFWIIGIIALLWNLMGVTAYLADAYKLIPIPENMQAYYDARPSWVIAAYAIAVFAGTLGCILLLMRRKLAKTVFIISFLGVIVQQSYIFFMTDVVSTLSSLDLSLTIAVIIIAILLIWYSNTCIKKGWLR